MARTATKPEMKPKINSPLRTAEERLRVWGKAEGIWKHRKPDPIKELRKMRKEWEHDLV
ncbi:MAG: hypothetical protein ACRERD_23120 [Candidatus Binatia bacterium]